MGLIKAAVQSAGGLLSDQWKDFFYCPAIDKDILAVEGRKKGSRREKDNVISRGSIISVADGQCMIIVDNGQITELCALPGEFVYDSSSQPSIFAGDLAESIGDSFRELGRRFSFGGSAGQDQRVYYINTKELTGNKYGTPNPVPFRVKDERIGLDIDISIKCFGEYSYKITDPIAFYTNVCGNFSGEFSRDEIDSQMKSELLTALQPAFAKISQLGIRYSALPAHTVEITQALDQVLSQKWKQLRGIQIVSFGMNSVRASQEDEQLIKDIQRNTVFTDPRMAAAQLAGAQAQAMRDAAKNPAGAAMGFMGMNMAAGGMDVGRLYQMGMEQSAGQAVSQAEGGWLCPQCGSSSQRNFCPQCGCKKPGGSWHCSACGTENQGRFCTNCGAKKPEQEEGPVKYRCDKCGWQPADPAAPPRFCPQCGDPFDSADKV